MNDENDGACVLSYIQTIETESVKNGCNWAVRLSRISKGLD